MNNPKNKFTKIELIGDRSAKVIEAMASIVDPSELNVKLYSVNSLESFKRFPNAYNLLVDLINLNTRQQAYISTILNAIFSQRTDCFMLSRSYMDYMLTEEPNHSFNKINSRNYSALRVNLLAGECPVLHELMPWTRGIPGFYRVNKEHPVYPILKDIISEEFLDVSFKYKSEWYADYRKAKLGHEDDIPPEEKAKWREEGKKRRGEL